MFSLLSSFSSLRLASRPVSVARTTLGAYSQAGQIRCRNNLAPRKVKWAKRQKGTVPIPIGGSTKGTTLAYGEWGIRIKGNGARLSAKQLQVAEEVLKRKLKVIKGAKVYMRIFPHIPVCVKVRVLLHGHGCMYSTRLQGNETRMGKGKGTFEFWAAR